MQGNVKSQGERGAQPIAADQIRQAVERITHSRTLERSEQLKTILLVLSNAVAEGRASEITEAMIGERILNRRDFDPGTDTIVRVQMRRLRSKLEEYYRTEGAEDPIRLEIPRYSYVPQFIKVEPAPAPPQPRARTETRGGRGFWRGFAAASGLFGVFAAIVLLKPGGDSRRVALDPAVAESPFWSGFVHPGSQPIIALSTPLFFRTQGSYFRDFRMNFHEDLAHARSLIGNQQTWPSWTTFVSLSDAESALFLERLFSASGSRAVVKSAREVTSGELQQNAVVFLGHPRGSLPLMDLLAGLPFYVRRTSAAQPVRGIVNRSPRPGEPPEYFDEGENDLEILSENRPDFVLVTALTRPSGASVLSVFGNRYASAYPVLQLLADASHVKSLRQRVVPESEAGWGSAGLQVVFRVSYLNGRPIDVKYMTHRLLNPDLYQAGIK